MEAKGDYNSDEFDVVEYLETLKNQTYVWKFLHQCLHEFFSGIDEQESLKLLDYACGPTVVNLISATSKATEITLADYSTPFREFMKKWLKDASIYNWSPFFSDIVENLEGRTHEEAVKREELLRGRVKAVVECDITKAQFIEKGYEGPYDVVMCFLALENTAASLDEYRKNLKRLASLVKENGNLLICDITHPTSESGSYEFMGKKFDSFNSTDEDIVSTLEKAGFSDIVIQHMPKTDKDHIIDLTSEETLIFLSAKKN